MRFFGFYVLALRGEIYLQIMETGKIRTDGFADGETRECGKGFWKH